MMKHRYQRLSLKGDSQAQSGHFTIATLLVKTCLTSFPGQSKPLPLADNCRISLKMCERYVGPSYITYATTKAVA
jgi:hypothetical protein